MKFTLSAFMIITCLAVQAQKSLIYATDEGAIKGHDPVAYFLQGAPVKGLESLTINWNGAEWHFSSKEHLTAFSANPEKYAPQFGGYCAYGVSKGGLYKTEPDAWKIVDEKLYLNYSKAIQKKWETHQNELIKKAEANWSKMVEK